jgi:protein ImuB
MEQFLVERDAALLECRWHFHHRTGQGSTRLALSRALPAARAADWGSLLAERLERLPLPAPVVSISLRSGPLLPAVPLTDGLAGHAAADRAAALRLLDRLRARLGEEAVHGVCLIPEHRPEAAYRRTAAAPPQDSGAPPAWPGTSRPLWLVAEPQPLSVRDARPWHGGPLQLLSGPERIESGWWGGSSVARDYYVARAASGVRLWIYRARDASAWFLHGVFA